MILICRVRPIRAECIVPVVLREVREVVARFASVEIRVKGLFVREVCNVSRKKLTVKPIHVHPFRGNFLFRKINFLLSTVMEFLSPIFSCKKARSLSDLCPGKVLKIVST